MQQYAIVFFPKGNLEKLQNFREKYDLGWKTISPHLTIVSPVSQIPESQLVEYVESVIKDLQPFSIRLIGLTKTSDDCLFLLVQGSNEKIINLHEKLYLGILAPYMPTNFPFIPHLTLGCFQTKDNQFDQNLYHKAYAEAENLKLDINCKFDSLSLIKGDGITPAKIIKTFIFK